MKRRELLLIAVLAVLGTLIVSIISVLTVLGAPERVEFALMLVLFAAILLGAYWFVIVPFARRR